MHGRGSFRYANGNEYVGEFREARRQRLCAARRR
jgi:hypothetical protein